MRITRKKSIVVGVVIAGLMGGSALAYWTTTGGSDSTGTATAGLSSGITVAQTSTPSNLRPGSGAQDIAFTLTNPSSTQAVYVTKVVATIASVVKAPLAPAGVCDATDFTLVSDTKTIAQDFAPSEGPTAYPTGLSIEFNNKAANQDGCQGATVHLTLTAS